jgi:CheY-like chemotaxis protein
MLRRLVGENIILQFRFMPSLPAIEADLGMLEQAISNLVLHARESMPAGGPLMIETGLSQFDEAAAKQHPERQTGKFVCLGISDTGPGLDAAALARILEPPLGHDPEAPPRLGLHIANGVVKQAHGWIEVQSQLGKGTTFKVYWPAATQKAETLEGVAPQEPVRGGAETILVVEDEPSIRELAKAILLGYGYSVCDAGSGEEALSVFAQQGGRIDLLFTDMVMPGQLTGRMLAERLEAQKPSLKVLYTTGYSLDLVQSNIALKPGFNLLSKPYSSASLAQAVRRTLDRAT